jgi:type VI secretion system protein VasG
MPAITRDVVFGKLGSTAMKTLQGAFEFARMRTDAYIEPVHWLALMLRTDNSDVPLMLDRLEVSREQLTADIGRALEALRRSRSSRLDFSRDLELVIERGWISASLMFGAARIRTGHLLHGMLEQSELRRLLYDISPAFKGIDAEAVAARFQELTRGSSEEADDLAAEAPLASAVAAGEPGAPGRGEKALEKYTADLTEQARAGKIDPILGRDREIREVIDILMRRRQNNPIIVGEAGVGKTALVEGLALRIATGDVPPPLKDIRLLGLDLAAMQAGASVRGEFENRLKQVIEEVQASTKPIILFIDEAHTLIGAGGTAGTGDAANLLKPALARGTLRTIAATTWAEYKKHIEKDPALTRRFQVVQVDEPEEEPAIRMLRGMAGVFEDHHKIQLLDEAVASAVRLSARYIQGRQLPDKAVSVLDTACARVAMSQHATPPGIEDTRRRITDLESELAAVEREKRIGVIDEPREASLREQITAEQEELSRLEARYASEQELVERILELRARLRGGEAEGGSLGTLEEMQKELARLQGEAPLVMPAVDSQAVASIVESWTGIPVGRMLTDEIEAVLTLKDSLRGRVIGQDHALETIAKRIETARAGLDNPGKPKGVFLLVGPSGVGKTETALALAEQLFGGEDHLISINMSEFQEAHTVSTLKGAPPGYVGYGEGGRLTEAVRRKPYSVVLLDEIEKAHPDVHELFFQVFDKGVMEDGEGRRIDFKNTLILLTSNVGSDLIMQLCADPDLLPEPEGIAKALRDPLLKVFPAALLGRLVTVPYYPLSDAMLNEIIRLQLSRIARRVEESREVPFTYEDSVVDLIRSRCTELESGGRMIDSILTGTLLPAVSREILERMRTQAALSRVQVGVADGQFTYAFD